MAEYRVSIECEVILNVEADSEAEAIQKAKAFADEMVDGVDISLPSHIVGENREERLYFGGHGADPDTAAKPDPYGNDVRIRINDGPYG